MGGKVLRENLHSKKAIIFTLRSNAVDALCLTFKRSI